MGVPVNGCLLVLALMCATAQASGDDVPEDLKAGLAGFALATGATDQSPGWFSTEAGAGEGESRQQALFAQAEEKRQAGDVDGAGGVLAGMREGYWAALGYLNLATTYAREDLDPSRALIALRVALAMAEKDPESARARDLRGRLLLRAGYLAYRNGNIDKAIGFLEKVGLDNYRTPQALYFHGLALAGQGNHRAAMQSWHRTRKYPLAYPGVADAWLAMGRGYDLAGYLGQSGEAYLAASAAYESERVTLQALAERIRSEGAYKALVEDARHSDIEWFLADNRTLTQPRMAYLLRFMENPDAQQAVARVASLAAMSERLSRQEHDLGVWIGSLESRLNDRAIIDSPPGDRLPNTQARLEARLQGLAAQPLSPSQQQARQQLAQTLADSASRLRALPRELDVRPVQWREWLGRSQALLRDTRRHLGTTAQLRQQAENRLDTLALAFVEAQDRQMAFGLDKTEQQIAHLYEYLALEKIGERQP